MGVDEGKKDERGSKGVMVVAAAVDDDDERNKGVADVVKHGGGE